MSFTIQVDPYNGMTAEQFGVIAEQQYETKLNPYRKNSAQSELMYYFCLWGDTLRQCAKHGAEPCFDAFMARVAIGDC